MQVERAAGEIARGAGTKYDPKVVEAFKKALPMMKKVRETYADALGDLINLDFAKTTVLKPAAQAPAPAPRPKAGAAEFAKAAAARKK